MRTMIVTILQAAALLLVGLLAGSVFSIWFGYDVTSYSQSTFVEVHQRAVRGLNDLLPLMGLGALVCVIAVAVLQRANRPALVGYGLAALGLVVAGVITRFGNQPINATVMGWSADNVPANWQALVQEWWMWHGWRVAATVVAFLALIVAVLRRPRLAAKSATGGTL
jgi:hypothetical protein